MSNFREIINRGNEGPALMFRAQSYDFACPDDFLADVMAMANADITGQRAIVLGVGPGMPGERELRGIDCDSLPSSAELQQLVDDYIEPEMSVQLMPGDDDGNVAVIVIAGCDTPPYLLKKPCGIHLQGASFIRRKRRNLPLSRGDFARLRGAAALPQAAPEILKTPQNISLLFEGGAPERSLAVIAQDNLPSAIAARKLESAIQSRAEVDAMGGADTGIVRLMHVRAFGLDEPFSKKSVDELKDELRVVRKTFQLEDKFHKFEKTGHRLNFVVTNDSGEALEDARVTLRLQREHGFEIAPSMLALGLNTTTRRRELTEVKSSRYPVVSTSGAFYEIREQVGEIRGHSRNVVFREPLRVALSDAAAGKSVSVYYELTGRGMGNPSTGSLLLRFESAGPA